MTLGNLSIKVNAAKSAQQGMGASSSAVDDFRASLMQASADMQRVALSMGGNMQAANDAITASTDESIAAIEGINKAAEKVDTRSMGEKVAFGLGAGIGAGVVAGQTAMDAFESYVKAKLIIVGLAIVTGIAAAVFTAIYAVYKVIDAIFAMMDGSFFKSENIDALIATNTPLLPRQPPLPYGRVMISRRWPSGSSQ